MEAEPDTAACYCCVFNNQFERGESLASQRARLVEVAELKGLMPEIFDEEDCVGIGIERPGLQRLIREIESGRIRMVLITGIGIIARRNKDLIYLLDLFEKHDVVLVSLAEGADTAAPTGSTILKLMVIVANLEKKFLLQQHC